MIPLERLQQILAAAPSLAIGLVGDLFLDRYLEIDPALSETSVETGLEAHQVTRIRNSPGAMGTVINNFVALGVGTLVPVSVVGDDGQAYDLLAALAAQPGVDTRHVLRDPARLTPTYTKPVVPQVGGGWRELNRFDLRNRAPLSNDCEERLLATLRRAFDATAGLIVADQLVDEWGVVTPRVRDQLHAWAAAAPDKLVFVDSRARPHRFSRCMLKPNVGECLRALGRVPPADGTADLATARDAAAELARRTDSAVFCTLGERGIWHVTPDGAAALVPGHPASGPIDPVGAGDSATAGIVLALLAGGTPVEAAAVGNLVASITVEQLGTTGTASPAQVLTRWHDRQPDAERSAG